MKAAPSSFYDHALDDARNASWLAVSESPYRRLYQRTVALVPRDVSVVELGCGTGRLASLLVPRAGSYVGIDFAPRCIAEAQRFVPSGAFVVADLMTEPIPPAFVYVANEVLEHLDDDLGLIERLPSGSRLVFSVPSFDSKSHVRYFPKRGEARPRYDAVLLIDHEEYVQHGRRSFFHLFSGIVR